MLLKKINKNCSKLFPSQIFIFSNVIDNKRFRVTQYNPEKRIVFASINAAFKIQNTGGLNSTAKCAAAALFVCNLGIKITMKHRYTRQISNFYLFY